MTTVPTDTTRGPERRTLTPLAAALTHLARLINDADLPDASIAVQAEGRIVSVNATLCAAPVDVVHAWAAALQLPVETAPARGAITATVVQAAGAHDGVFYVLRAILPGNVAVGRTDEVRADASVQLLAAGGA